MEKENVFIGTNIKYLRNKENISQTELAKFLGYGSSTISNWESGYRTPESIDLLKLSSYFRIPMELLVGVDLRFKQDNVELITAKEFEEEVKKLLRVADFDENTKNMFTNTLEYICKDGEK